MIQHKITLKLSSLFLFCLILFSCFKLSAINTSRNDFQNQYLVKNSLLIDSFDGFVQTHDSEYIDSLNTSSEISFIYEGTTSGWITERYIYTFNSQGNCANITIQTDLKFSLQDTNDNVNIGLEVGSYYTSDGSFIGDPPVWGDHMHSVAYIYDAWVASQATYAAALWGYEVTDEVLASTNEAGLSGNVTIFQQRIGTTLTCSFKNTSDNSNYFTHTWENQDYNINHLSIYINSRETYSNVSAKFTSISGNLTFIDENKSTIGFSGFTNIIAFSGIIVVVILLIYPKKKS